MNQFQITVKFSYRLQWYLLTDYSDIYFSDQQSKTWNRGMYSYQIRLMLDDDGTLMFRCGLESKSLVASLELLENDNESDTNNVLYLKEHKDNNKGNENETLVLVSLS